MSEPMDYASAGVDIDLEGSAVASLIGALSSSVRQPGTPGAPVDLPGGFGGLIAELLERPDLGACLRVNEATPRAARGLSQVGDE